MKFNNTIVTNFEGAIRGMRNPKNSWNRSDSYFGIVDSYNNPGFEVVEAWAKKEKPELYKSDATIEQENEKIDLLKQAQNIENLCVKYLYLLILQLRYTGGKNLILIKLVLLQIVQVQCIN